MTPEEQLEMWVEGKPRHNEERDECCPDFSCCKGSIVSESDRLQFKRAWEAGRDDIVYGMLLMFLSRAFEDVEIPGFSEV